jgi:hypothetical protein
MRNEQLINRNEIYKFCELVHTRAAAAIAGMGDPRQPVMHLCSASPNDTRFFTATYRVGDFARMADDCISDNAAGRNCFVEGRLCRAGLPHERGRLEATLAIFGLCADSDRDAGKQFTAPIPASAVVETSPGTGNSHHWYFLRRAIGWGDGQEFRKLVGRSAGGDACSFVVTQPYRCAGTINWPSKTKAARGRVPVPTKIKCVTGITYTIDELRAAFQPSVVNTPDAMPAVAFHSRGYSRSMVKMLLAAAPGLDRSAAFMSAANHAARAGMTADEFEILARRCSSGCAGKYIFEGGDRLTQEIARCYSKIAREHNGS